VKPGISSLKASQTGNYILCDYGHSAEILFCNDKENQSMFTKKVQNKSRKETNSFIRVHEQLSHIHFLQDSGTEGDIIALDNAGTGKIVKRNIALPSETTTIQLSKQDG
jgi:hypothetical protein